MRTVILFLGLAITAFGSDVVAQGDPPLTTGIVQNVTGILEWLAGSSFTAQQRAAVEQILTRSWRQRNITEITQWTQLSNLRPQLDALDANQKQALRRTLLAQVQDDAGPLANLVSSNPAPAPGGRDSRLSGKWEQRSGSSSITYQDRTTGSYAAPTGNINRYVFTPDGQYEYAELHQVSTYGCTTGYFGYEKGTYTVDGDRITFAQQQHSLEFKSTCNPSLNSNKNLPLTTATYFYQIGQGQYSRELVLTDGKTARWRFNRAD